MLEAMSKSPARTEKAERRAARAGGITIPIPASLVGVRALLVPCSAMRALPAPNTHIVASGSISWSRMLKLRRKTELKRRGYAALHARKTNPDTSRKCRYSLVRKHSWIDPVLIF